MSSPNRTSRTFTGSPSRSTGQRQKSGAIAQLGERLNGIQEVGGSTPPGSTTKAHKQLILLEKQNLPCHLHPLLPPSYWPGTALWWACWTCLLPPWQAENP